MRWQMYVSMCRTNVTSTLTFLIGDLALGTTACRGSEYWMGPSRDKPFILRHASWANPESLKVYIGCSVNTSAFTSLIFGGEMIWSIQIPTGRERGKLTKWLILTLSISTKDLLNASTLCLTPGMQPIFKRGKMNFFLFSRLILRQPYKSSHSV